MDWNVLLVEDDPDGQEVLARMLRHYKIAFDVAQTGEQALAMMSRFQYTAVVVDLSLPGMDGWSLLRTIQTNPAWDGIPCVAVTAYHSTDVAVKAIEAGFVAYFPKPLDTASFVPELRRALA